MSNESAQRASKSERRTQAREQARVAREAQVKKEKRNRLLLQGGIALGVVAVIAVVALIIVQVVQPAGPGPKNMAHGGVIFSGENFEVMPTASLEDGEELTAAPTDRTEAPLDIVIYVDYLCPHCALFEQQAGPMLEQWVGSGQATLQVYPMNFMDSSSGGAKYSTRAANTFACTVEQQPENAWNLHSLLLSADVQPEGGAGLTNDQLIEVAEQAGVTADPGFVSCVKDVRFGGFITKITNQALGGPIVGLADGAQLSDGNGGLQDADGEQHITGTPTVIVNGTQAPTSPAELEQFMLKLYADLTGANGANGADADAEADAEAEADTESADADAESADEEATE